MKRGKSYNLHVDKLCQVFLNFLFMQSEFYDKFKVECKKIFLIAILHAHCNN